MRTTTRTRFVEILSGQLGLKVEEIRDHESFAHMYADEQDLEEIVYETEREFNVDIGAREIGPESTVESVVRLLELKQDPRATSV
ncbi:MAG: hypothetical protein J5J00_08920 [Deltaproteobacteria bacterium]|nr:hypothetical protein [Deltaproteobacteria bacterium]